MTSDMVYFSRYKQLGGFAEIAYDIDLNFGFIKDIHDKKAVIDHIIKNYDEQGIIGNVPSYNSVLALWKNRKYLTSAGKRKLDSLGKIYEYKVNLEDIQIESTYVQRIRFSTDNAIKQFNKTFITLDKHFENMNYKKLMNDRLTYICNICYKYDCASIKELLFLCNNINKYEKEAYKIYKDNWDKTQGVKVRKMNELFDFVLKNLHTGIRYSHPYRI